MNKWQITLNKNSQKILTKLTKDYQEEILEYLYKTEY